MDPITGAAVITAGANLVGGLFGARSSKKIADKDRKESARQFNLMREDNANATQIRVADALKAGINPLAALGISQNVSPTVHAGGGYDNSGEIMANSIAGAGSAIGKAMADKAADDMNYDSQSKELDLEGKRLENRILQARLDSLTPSSPGNTMNVVPQNRVLEGESLVFRPAYDMEGRPRLVINQDVLEGDSDNPGYISTIATMYINGDIDHLTGKLSKDAAEKVRWLYHESTGRDLWNWQDMYVSPTEAAAAAAMFGSGFLPVKGVKND